MIKKGLMVNTFISTIGSVTTRLVGMCTMIYISNQIGAEGIGLYQLSITVYMMAYMVASAGIITSISKIIAEEISQGWFLRARQVMHIFLAFGFIISLIITSLIYINAQSISILIVKDTRIVEGLKILSLSIPFMTISACFKGYFYGIKDIIKPASAEVLEQIVKFGLTIILLSLFGTNDLTMACMGMSLAITLGEILSFTYLALLYLSNRITAKKNKSNNKPQGSLIYKICNVLFPITASSYLTAVFVLLENTLIPKGLQDYGLTIGESVSIYGMLKGMVFPLLLFPTALLSACSTILTPEIAKAHALKYKGRIESLTSRVLHLTLVIAFFIVIIFTLYGNDLGISVYDNAQVGTLLQIMVCMSPFMYVEIVIDGILKGLGEQKKCLEYRIIDAVFRIIMMYILIPKIGLNGLLATLLLSNIISSIFHINRLIEITKIKIDLTKWLFHPILCAVAAGLVTKSFLSDMLFIGMNLRVNLSFSILFASLFYLAALIALENITAEELSLRKGN
ncbi:MAG: hypothetical protein ATN31_06575 [Candidatus Epulonipiscioides saccharophilum]|nr:MAG: hypothetical protein ATN31_06575 [Epulopiscium sp. AS2M-Bin001]